ncbi:VCBS repeat-containing protein [Pseudozobellia sp. WGM2]|uniref:VCBS repeat-containing protein n=1 Tax=Pseudozobellia sp. WGM2 TaxID=2787625 RepID=UPI001ADF2829|nr:VCBS repeat-containing protein [Pseudozobellia sp. WGM2]
MNKAPALILVICTLLFMSCKKEEPNTLFEALTTDKTGISFTNTIVETEELNVMQYEYMYNGGGVSIGDFNGDGLPDLYLTGNSVENRLYLNKGDFEFDDITVAAGVQGRKGWKTGTSVADINGDGLLDIYVCYSGLGSNSDRANQLFINQGNVENGVPIFKDEASTYGLDAEGSYSTQAAFLDYDLDGDLDMFLLNHSKTFYSPFFNSTKLRKTRHPLFGNSLYKNDNGHFENVSEIAGIHGSGLNFGLGVAISDFNQDGWPDIYVSNDYEEQDFLYLNNSDGKFQDITKNSFGHISKFSMGNDAADLNNDGNIDLVTLDMLPEDNYRQKLLKGPDEFDRYQIAVDSGYHKQHMRNMLQLGQGLSNKHIPKFAEVGQLSGISNTDWSWAPLIADFDNDGYKDLFITNGYLRDYTNKDFMKFEMNEAIAKVRAKGGEMFDTKGKKEYSKAIYELVQKMPSTKIPNYMYKNTGQLFENVSSIWGISEPTVSTGAAYADFDNDGDLDLVVNNTNQPLSIYKNRSEKKGRNFIRIKLKGEDGNTHAIGAKVWVYTDSTNQFLENYNVRGYQSSVDPILQFGLGKSDKADLKIQWPNGNITTKENIAINALHEFQQANSAPNSESQLELKKTIFENTSDLGLDFVHNENDYIDFKVNRLALKQSSRYGPKMSISDVNNDGLEDVFIGGAFEQNDALFLSRPDGTYRVSESDCFGDGKAFESAGSVFFDADLDGDMDLYVVSGGGEPRRSKSVLADRLFLNKGNGDFEIASKDALPEAHSNGSVVAAADYDDDGDIDLFVGASNDPSGYPIPGFGGILRNDTERATGKVKFTLATNEVNPDLRQPGIITAAVWTDVDKNSLPDLVIAGEWMPIRIFLNKNGKLVEKTKEYGLSESNGMWQSIEKADMDGDGDIDLIVGNLGLNTPFKVSKDEPLEAYVGDFRNDGVLTPVISNYIQGKRYPIASLNEIQDAFPQLKKKFLYHKQYASATLKEIFSEQQLEEAMHFSVFELRSLYLENKGGHYQVHRLPLKAQFSSVQSVIAKDFTGDEKKDLFLAGNFFPFKVEYGPSDASKGLLLEGDGKGSFKEIENNKSGIWLEGDVRDIKLINRDDHLFIIATKNNDSTQVIKFLP